MIYEGYAALSDVYDLLNNEVDYEGWAKHIKEIFTRYEKVNTSLVLDLGCGTGKMTLALNKLGYDMTGVDISPEMLSVARESFSEQDAENILLLCQDMTDFELYGTVEAAVCCLDGINHLTRRGDVSRCFGLVHNYLVPNGLFVFDINTPHKFDTVYGSRDYIMEDDGVLFAWQNDYDRKRKICSFYMSVFSEEKSGIWSRKDGIQRERCFSLAGIKRLLRMNGFEMLSVTDGYSFNPPSPDCDRWCITARCLKKSPTEESTEQKSPKEVFR